MSAPNSSTNWDVELSSWIIQDGNYPDFAVGQTAEFALEFWLPPGRVAQASGGEVSASNIGGCLYDTVAEVVLQTAQITILDIGILVYKESASLPSSFPR